MKKFVALAGFTVFVLSQVAAAAEPVVVYSSGGQSWTAMSPDGVAFAEATAACSGLGAGWRLPSMEEIQRNWFTDGKPDDRFKNAAIPVDRRRWQVWTTTVDSASGEYVTEFLSGADQHPDHHKAHLDPSRGRLPFLCVKKGTLQTAQQAPAAKPAASASKAVSPKLTLQASDYGEKVRKHDEKVQKTLAAIEARSVKEQAEADRKSAEEQRQAKDRAAASYKPCPAGSTCNTVK